MYVIGSVTFGVSLCFWHRFVGLDEKYLGKEGIVNTVTSCLGPAEAWKPTRVGAPGDCCAQQLQSSVWE